jgi:ADP-dependent NAD(P)H-hydrate dehydratase / NAD(P)H-hydrate epimerase
MKILTAAQIGQVDSLTTELFKIPSILLMENAGRSVVDEMDKACPGLVRKRILIFCGKGNNGGDGLTVARHLTMRGAKPEIVLLSDPAQLRGDPLTNWDIVKAMGLPVHVLETPGEVRIYLRKTAVPDVIVDAIFGTGLSKPVGPGLRPVINWINQAAEKAFIASVDIPSGLLANSQELPGAALRAHLTVTFTALKLALVAPPAAKYAGRVVVVPIGSPSSLLDVTEHRTNLIDAAQVRRALPPRAQDSHKGNFGHVYVVAGSRGKSGAALMTGMAALRSGAGLVTLWLPVGLQKAMVGKFPELMTEYLPETKDGTSDAGGLSRLRAQLSNAEALVLGPGVTTQAQTRQLIRELVRCSPVPVILDADGINAFSSAAEKLRNEAGQPVIITPHPGEMARLLNRPISEIQKRRIETARACSELCRCYCVLKGYQTIVSTPEGEIFINSTGNPGMATGGSGDILAGIMGRFVAGWNRKRRRADSANLADHLCAAVYLHGLAGDLAAAEVGMESLVATDLLPYLPNAFKAVLI